MLPPDRVKAFLTHDDPDVRGHAAQYFGDSWSDDPALLPLVLDSCEAHGVDENIRCLDDARRFTITEDSLDRLLDLLARTKGALAIDRLNEIIQHAPVELVRGRQEAVEAHPNVLSQTRVRLQRRRDFSEWSGDRLWEELQEFARRAKAEGAEYAGDIDYDYSDDLVEALGRHDVPDAGTILRLLKELEPEEGWLELFLIDLAGRRRLREAVPVLVDKLHIDADFVLENSSDALARIGDPEAVALIRRTYPDASSDFRIYAIGVLGKIKHPESEAAILALLEAETDENLRIWLCSSLCDLISEQALDAAMREVRSTGDAALHELASVVLTVAAMLDVAPSPELKTLERERSRQRASMRRFERETRAFREGLARGDHPRRLEYNPFGGLEVEEIDGPAPSAIQPIRNTGARVGRNDPCPCGSGKKYKKCCGRSG